MTGYWRAMDTFVAEIDGIPHGVVKGAVLPDGDLVVQHDRANGGRLFQALDTGEDEKPPPKSAKADPAPKAAPVKAAGGKS